MKCTYCNWIGTIKEADNITGQCGLFCPKCGASLPDPVQYFFTSGPKDNPNGPGWYFTDETVTENMQIIKHIGPYQEQKDAERALMRFNDAVRALRGPGGPYIHLREKPNEPK